MTLNEAEKWKLYLKHCRRHQSNYIIEVRRSKHWPEHTNNSFSFPSVARFLRFLFSAIFSSYLESSAVYSLLLWASTVNKHTTRRLPFLLQEFNDEAININIFVFMYMWATKYESHPSVIVLRGGEKVRPRLYKCLLPLTENLKKS